jgi:F0F1-type ATP synthase assembly protein I
MYFFIIKTRFYPHLFLLRHQRLFYLREPKTNKMEDNKDDAKQAARKVGGLLFVGCMFIGMAAGFYFHAVPMGLFGGMGIGFILMAVAIMSDANKR